MKYNHDPEPGEGPVPGSNVISFLWKGLFLFLVGFPVFWLGWLVLYIIMPGPSSGAAHLEVVIPKASSFHTIKEILADRGVIRDDARFTMLAGLMGMASRLRAGEYSLRPGLKPYQVLEILAAGKVVRRKVTIPEGVDIYRVADILAADGWVERIRFLDLLHDPALISELGLSVPSLEGYLFPDSYSLSREQQDEQAIIRMMVMRLFQVLNGIPADIVNRTSLSRHEILTLASVVEKETAQDFERPLIAGVFLNRLKKNMPLQADPTVAYGRPEFSGKLTRRDLETPTPYNTYLIKGLPPGPIGNPGRMAIMAVLEPAVEPHLYFVARNDGTGTHQFSKTLREHNRAVARYRRK